MADGELVVARGDGAVPLEAVDPALERVTFAVGDRGETRRPPAEGAELPAVAG
ncbi:hypothetical protein ACFQ9J_03440 [Streptomyces sp. NPDC056529]|uniref:hypothetical protein n=1 Tax=Streptomyces sp. NPDC056529 TaxID=3345855 RepID=UPI003687E84B